MTKTDLIVMNNVSFGFTKEANIIYGINLEVSKGDSLAILGASGSGKTTLLRIVANILPQNKRDNLSGTISIFGKSPFEYLNTGKLSLMFQDSNLMPNLNVKKNIEFPLKLRGKKIDVAFIEDLLIMTGLKEHEYKFPSELSGGMKTRVALARAFVTKPELLLLDEPFSDLDISRRYILYSYLETIKKRFKTTIILVTHNEEEAVLLANKIIVLSSKGEVLSSTNVKQNLDKDFNQEPIIEFKKKNQDKIFQLQSDILSDGRRNNIYEK